MITPSVGLSDDEIDVLKMSNCASRGKTTNNNTATPYCDAGQKVKAHERRRPKRNANPLQAGIVSFLRARALPIIPEEREIPRRYTRYGSLLLLGPTFSVHSALWAHMYSSLADTDRTDLFHNIVEAFNDTDLTHVAINAPIAATTGTASEQDNIKRSPTGLQLVYGDFGPDVEQRDDRHLTQNDFDRAYWTQTTQLQDIIQVWAPRWTMFSRGNISEKARILQDSLTKSPFIGLTPDELEHTVETIDVLDFYIGIGYFAFSYLKRGVARVWGWDLNGWSIEGLRRGCVANGWGVRVIKLGQDGTPADGNSIRDLVSEILSLDGTADTIRCIAFWGDNRSACELLYEARSLMNTGGNMRRLNVRHCNLGLLPTSEGSWDSAVRLTDAVTGGWLHVHENVATADISAKQQHILQRIQALLKSSGMKAMVAQCCHVEKVKQYAPGVVHCVYDIRIYPSE